MKQEQLARQLVQNLVAILALVFAQRFLEIGYVLRAAAAYIVLSATSVLVLGVSHAVLTGWIPETTRWWSRGSSRARAVAGGLSASAVGAVIIWQLGWPFVAGLVVYALLAVLHDVILSRIVLVDVILLGIEFSLKAALGALALRVRISPWLLLCTFFLALMVALGKRRNELRFEAAMGPPPREVLTDYSPRLLDQLLAVVTSSSFLAFAIYTVQSQQTHAAPLIYTLPFVLFGILRYLYLVHRSDMREGSELMLLRDPASLVNIMIWLGLTALLIWPA